MAGADWGVVTIIIVCCSDCIKLRIVIMLPGTGNVLKVQHLLHICSEHYDIKDQVWKVVSCLLICTVSVVFMSSLETLGRWRRNYTTNSVDSNLNVAVPDSLITHIHHSVPALQHCLSMLQCNVCLSMLGGIGLAAMFSMHQLTSK